MRHRFIVALLAMAALSALATARAQIAPQTEFDNSPAGLKHLIESATKAAKQKDDARLKALTAEMVIPDPATWFLNVFGSDIGMIYARNYAQTAAHLPAALAQALERLSEQQFTTIEVTRFIDACDDHADESEYPLLASRQEPEPLSKVAFHHGNSFQVMRYFAFIDGAFRYVGSLEPYPNVKLVNPQPQNPDDISEALVNVTDEVQKTHIIKQVAPQYPLKARAEYWQGVVAIHTIISKEGIPIVLTVFKGRCILAESAIDAVRQWRYSPTLVDGKPAEVRTDITVTFILGKQ